jgi:hypothetical protein
MAIGEFTKQIAQQAILSATTKEPAPPPGPGQPENVSGTFLAQIAAMQKALKEDEELAVHYHSGAESIRVLEVFAPSRQVLVLTGTDSARTLTRVIASVDSLQLICKIGKTGGKPVRVNLVTPKP